MKIATSINSGGVFMSIDKCIMDDLPICALLFEQSAKEKLAL